jgi:hypothetical protein
MSILYVQNKNWQLAYFLLLINSEYEDLPYYIEIRWLMLKAFYILINN